MFLKATFVLLGFCCVLVRSNHNSSSVFPDCSVNLTLPQCAYHPCKENTSICREQFLKERIKVIEKIERLRMKIKHHMEEEGKLRYQSTPSNDLPSLFPELIKGERLKKSFKPVIGVLESLFVYIHQLAEKERTSAFTSTSMRRLQKMKRLLINILCRVYKTEIKLKKNEITTVCPSQNPHYTKSIFGMFEKVLAKVNSSQRRRRKRRC